MSFKKINKIKKKIFILLGLALAGPGPAVCPAWAHGAGYRQAPLPSVPLEFFYSTGEPMSFRETKIFSPDDEKFAWQSGRTDEAGRFAFIPDRAGEWRVIVRDEEGHQAVAALGIPQEFLNGASSSSLPSDETETGSLPRGSELFIRAGLGVSLLFNMAAFVLLYKNLKDRKAGQGHAHQ